ncbi:MAG: metalloregulator ArsR/SmtB family transcription factor [Candidatus Thiodiazotropha sp. (ex Monitilora ramsayi)]|nr:metalloregulator ArsR/SmtB family transcription factor [Candidatus Thiodiazotropha sp. (ex Monitilora ramsayi)]
MNIKPMDLFSSLSHETRLRCVSLLLQHDELCVCELTHAIGAAQPHISRHLAHLREAGLILDRREGLWIHYRINPDLPSWVLSVLSETLHGIKNAPPFKEDHATLTKMPNRPGAPRCA